MAKRKGGGLGSLFTTIIWVLVTIGVLLASSRAMGVNSMEDSVTIVKDKAIEYSKCIPAGECGISSIFDDIKSTVKGNGSSGGLSGGKPPKEIEIPSEPKDFGDVSVDREEQGYRGPKEGEPYVNNSGLVNKNAAYSMLKDIETVADKEYKKKKVDYSRSEWRHWTGDKDRPCWNTRAEILHRDAVPGTIKYIDKKKKATDEYNEACVVGIPVEKDGKIAIETEGAGEWIDPYSGKKITDSRTIDIDHIIPLSNAAKQGGQEWSAEKKEEFANDPDNLLATSAKENRSKGAKGPGEYMPPKKSYHCQYAKTYTSLSYKYDLTITDSDYKVLNKTIENCKH